LYLIVKHTAKEAGVEFSPHDARRTLITETLNNQVPLAEVQAQAGHANGSTTLRYAQSGDAKTRRSLLRLRYG
jgi:integrase